MKEKTRTILLGILMSLLIVTVMSFALTYGRFSEEKTSSNDDYGSDFEYIVSDQIEVRNIDEFIGAIENGYSNIVIANDAADSFVITGGVTDIGVDLTLNLNGHCIIRNSRDPMLNVKSGVRLTVIDSSAEQTGSFYNPVGSVLKVSGGTLTVSSGTFESGPRKEEYSINNSTQIGGRISGSIQTEVFVKNAENTAYESAGTVYMPTIEAQRASGNLLNGNMYFEQQYNNNAYITADTFLYYTRASEDTIRISANAASADFYYKYDEADGQSVTVFGYNRVKTTAREANSGFATVSMESGNMYARGGDYKSYFGVSTAYGIHARGGYMAVESGDFSVIESGTGIRCEYSESDTSSQEYLRISDGMFSCEYGDAIQVAGGKLTLTGGTFIKNALGAPSGTPSAVIRITDGTLADTGDTNTAKLLFDVQGSDVYGIYAVAESSGNASLTLRDTEFKFADGSNNLAIYAAGSTIGLTRCTFTMEKENTGGGNGGIRTQNSTLTLEGCEFVIPGTDASGVFVEKGNVTLADCRFDILGSGASTGVSVNDGMLTYSGGAVAVTGTDAKGLFVQNGTVEIGGITVESEGLGIGVESGSVTVSHLTGLDGNDLNVNTSGTAVRINGGNLTLNEGTTSQITSQISADTWGSDSVYVSGGSFESLGVLNITHTGLPNDNQYSGGDGTIYQRFAIKSFAVRVQASESGSSAVIIRSGNITNTVGGGIYVGQSDISTAEVNVSLGVENRAEGENALSVATSGTEMFGDNIKPASGAASNWNYQLTKTGGHAVEVNGGDLTVYDGSYSAKQGEGLLVKNGTATIRGGSFIGNDTYKQGAEMAGPAASYSFKQYGGNANIYGGTFGDPNGNGSGAFVMGTSQSNRGNANIHGGNFEVGGQAGFSIYNYANVLFEEQDGRSIVVDGLACGIALESSAADYAVKIRSGSFSSHRPSGGDGSGIWYGSSRCELTIEGGDFTGSLISGLRLDANPTVQISGGTFTGASGGISGNAGWTAQNILVAGYTFNRTNGNRTWTCVQS